ncbi:MAG: oligosaccharide flippase family protein, partial [Armatimonadota bacterium]
MEQAETTGTVTSTYAEIAKVFRHAMVYGVASVTSGVIGFIMIPVYTRCLSPAEYGIVELLQLTSNVLGIVLGMGFGTAVLRFYFQYDSERDRHEVISTALAVLVAVGTGVTILLLFGSEWLGRLVLGESGYGLFAALMLLTSLFGLVLIVPLAYVRALERSALYGGIAIGRLLLGLTLNIVFVVVLRMGVLGVLLSALVVALVSAIGLLGGTLRKVRLAVSRVKLRQMATYGGPLVPASLSMFVLHFADRFFLERAASLEQVGLYALGYKFAMMLPMLVMEPFGLVWGAAMFAVAKRDDARDIYGKVCTYFFCVATFFA